MLLNKPAMHRMMLHNKELSGSECQECQQPLYCLTDIALSSVSKMESYEELTSFGTTVSEHAQPTCVINPSFVLYHNLLFEGKR